MKGEIKFQRPYANYNSNIERSSHCVTFPSLNKRKKKEKQHVLHDQLDLEDSRWLTSVFYLLCIKKSLYPRAIRTCKTAL